MAPIRQFPSRRNLPTLPARGRSNSGAMTAIFRHNRSREMGPSWAMWYGAVRQVLMVKDTLNPEIALSLKRFHYPLVKEEVQILFQKLSYYLDGLKPYCNA